MSNNKKRNNIKKSTHTENLNEKQRLGLTGKRYLPNDGWGR